MKKVEAVKYKSIKVFGSYFTRKDFSDNCHEDCA